MVQQQQQAGVAFKKEQSKPNKQESSSNTHSRPNYGGKITTLRIQKGCMPNL
jgi:hypothetical protein